MLKLYFSEMESVTFAPSVVAAAEGNCDTAHSSCFGKNETVQWIHSAEGAASSTSKFINSPFILTEQGGISPLLKKNPQFA